MDKPGSSFLLADILCIDVGFYISGTLVENGLTDLSL